MSSNSFIVRPVNDLKSNGFLDNYSMKAKREQDDDKLMVIKLFSCNYARDLLYSLSSRLEHSTFIKLRKTSNLFGYCLFDSGAFKAYKNRLYGPEETCLSFFKSTTTTIEDNHL